MKYDQQATSESSTADPSELVGRLIDVWERDGWNDADTWNDSVDGHPGWCLNATAIGMEALRRHGIRSSPRIGTCLVSNAEGRKMAEQGLPASEWPADAHSVGVVRFVPEPKEMKVNGHVVISVGGGILDLSSGQFNRRRYNMMLPPLWYPPKSKRRGTWQLEDEMGTVALLSNLGRLPSKLNKAGGMRIEDHQNGIIVAKLCAQLNADI